MQRQLSLARYEQIVQRFAGQSILVLGDLMVDEYVRGSVRRISPESPVMIVETEADEFKPGGAANVSNNLHALGARVSVMGVVGDDEMGRRLRRELTEQGMDVCGLVTDASRPTTRKTRVVAQNQQVLRIDKEKKHPLPWKVEQELLYRLTEALPSADALLVSDYRKGVVSQHIMQAILKQAQACGKPLLANPKPVSAPWLQGARMLSLNQSEACELGMSDLSEGEEAFRSSGERLHRTLGVETLVVTCGLRGLAYWRCDGSYQHIPAHTVDVYDVAGAGDTVISAMTLALVSGADDYEAAEIANHAGACVVRKAGVGTVKASELLQDWHH